MERIISNFVPITVDGYVESTLPSDVFQTMLEEVNDIYLSDFKLGKIANQDLVGAIENEFYLSTCLNKLQPFLDIMVKQFVSNTKFYDPNYRHSPISYCWANFQKKYEYNPLHDHSTDLSFVTWLNIPYNNDDEYKLPHLKNNNDTGNLATGFNFVYINSNGKLLTYTYGLNKNSVGKIILFRSGLNHMVYPFYSSDAYRISVAGNINLVYE